jgi:putative tryptophan/tyrosine transport system substrate-binding protein
MVAMKGACNRTLVGACALAVMVTGLVALAVAHRCAPAGMRQRVLLLGLGSATNQAFFGAFREAFEARHPALAAGVQWVQLPADTPLAAYPQAIQRMADAGLSLVVARNGSQTETAHQMAPRAPLLFWSHVDPRTMGVVQSLAAPGGQATGLWVQDQLDAKRLELLLDAYPSLRRVGLLVDPVWLEDSTASLPGLQAQAQARGVTLSVHSAQTDAAALQALDSAALRDVQAWLLPRTMLSADGAMAREIAARGKPVMAAHTPDVHLGAHLSYAHDRSLVQPTLADLAARILQGERPADIPVQTLHRYQLAVRISDDARLPPLNPALVRRADVVVRP